MSEPSSGAKVRTSLDDGVFVITLADEANRNALSVALVAELLAAFDRVDEDDDIRVAVVTNTGRVFCAGADLSERSGDATESSAHPSDVFGRIRNSPKPYVGRIAGHAVAGGMGLAAAMDISVATTDAKFGFTEVRVGVAPAMISVICLPKMRQADAAAAMLRGNRFPASEAVELGLVNRAVPSSELDGAVDEIVADLREGSPAALAATKQLIQQVPTMAFDDAMAWTATVSGDLFAGPDADEGMSAFLEKRPPAWSPRAEGQR